MPKAGFVHESRPHGAIGLKHQPPRGLATQRLIKITGTLTPSLLRTANASYTRDVAMRLATDIGFKANFVAQIVDEARAEIPRLVIGIMHRDDVFELRRTALAHP